MFVFQCALLYLPAAWLVHRLHARGTAHRFLIVESSLVALALVYLIYLESWLFGRFDLFSAYLLHAFNLAVAAGAVILYGRRAGTGPTQNVIELPPFVLWSRALVFALIGLGVLLNLRTPIGGWDALSYHLDFPLQWLHNGAIVTAPTAYGDYSPNYYPMLVESLAAWLMLPASSTSTVDLVQVLFVPLLYFALRDIAYYYNNGEDFNWSAELAPLLVLSLPYAQSSLLVADNDVALAAVLAACWRAWLRAREPGHNLQSRAALVALPAGLTLCVKYAGAIYLAALLLALAIGSLLQNPRRNTERESPDRRHHFLLLIFTGIALGIGTSQYLINWWETGNPMYPGTLELAGWQLFAGYYPADFFRDHPFHKVQLSELFANPGFSLPLLFAAGLALPAYFRATTAPERRRRIEACVVPLFFLLAFLWLSPLRQTRLALPLIFACTGVLALAHSWPWRRPIQLLFAGVLIVHGIVTLARFAELYDNLDNFEAGILSISLNEISRATARIIFTEPTAMLVLSGALLLVAGLWYGLHKRRAFTTAGAIVFALALLCLMNQQHSQYTERGLLRFYNLMQGRPGQAVGVIGTNAIAPFRNAGQTPVHLLINRPAGERLLHERNEHIDYIQDEQRWLAIGTLAQPEIFAANVRTKQLDTLVFATLPGTGGEWPAEFAWLAELPSPWQCQAPIAFPQSGDPAARLRICFSGTPN